VDEVLQSGRETYTVFCVSRREYASGLRARAREDRSLADELLEAARHTSEAVTDRRDARRFRRYMP
jgi:hypothetical protein